MTVLLTNCPGCGSNFMLLDTETGKGHCALCPHTKNFDEKEIRDAETRRDSISDRYLPRLEKVYGEKDYEAMAQLAEEVANEGVSSWYAWYCVGWFDLHEGNIGPAFDDFKLAALFLDEENFDEFYELTMDAVLNSIEEAARNDKNWSTEDTTMVEFTGTLFERFEHLCEDDFMIDLMLRLGSLSDSIDKASMGGSLIKEIMMIILDYMSGNTYVVDHQALLNNARNAVDQIDEAMQERSGDGTLPINTVKIWGKGFSEFIGMLISAGDSMVAEYSDDELLTLCDYWAMNDYETVFNLLQNAFEFHLGFMLSNGRNKGIQKKRDKALADYEAAFKRPLVEGLTTDDDYQEDFDRICPDCGKTLKADEEGLLRCECGFRSRVVTEDINDLPENVQQLMAMGRKAIQDRDPRMLNNIGERILEFEPDNWFGFMSLAQSCILDGEIGEAEMLFAQTAERLSEKDRKEFRDLVVEELGRAFSENEDPEQQMSAVFIPVLLESISLSKASECKIAQGIIERMTKGTYDSSAKGFMATMVINPSITFELMHNTSLNYQKAMCIRYLALLDSVEKGMNGIRKDEFNLKDDVMNFVRTNRDVLKHLMIGIEANSGKFDDERIGYMSGYWAANMDQYENLAGELVDAFQYDEDIVYKANSNQILKSYHMIDTYLDEYMNAGKE